VRRAGSDVSLKADAALRKVAETNADSQVINNYEKRP
jgi:hypothetical protein